MIFFSFFFVACSTKSCNFSLRSYTEPYSEPYQISKRESFAKPLATVSENAPSYMFDRVLNMPLVSVIVL